VHAFDGVGNGKRGNVSAGWDWQGGWFQRRVVVIVVDHARRNAWDHAAERIWARKQERPLFEITADKREYERINDDNATEKR
jgi:hypothetical protein